MGLLETGILGILVLLGLAVAIAVGIGFIVLGFRLVTNFFTLVKNEIVDAARLVGSVVVSILYIPLCVLNLVIGRWSAASHYGRALQDEVRAGAGCVYRIAVGHPLRFFGVGGVVEGVEQRLPEVMAAAPTADLPARGRMGQFEGYGIIGSLPAGGSGAKLYIAEPDAARKAAFEKDGFPGVDRVVIKAFSLTDGSSLPQIVRESRSLDAAKRLGLILDHAMGTDRFHYVMRYVPGDSLSMATRRLHAQSAPGGLDPEALRAGLAYVSDLVDTLSIYHKGGLWHKDVKPDNVIIDHRDGRAHLVDFGLVSSLRSAMTLTTHGTEFFRDPEMVRLAIRGVKVHEVDGTRFDIYGAGAVLYSVVEDSFPAHGELSQVSKRCPDAVKWIIRRAMTGYEKRYDSAELMLADIRTVLAASDPFAVRPAELPSVRGIGMEAPAPLQQAAAGLAGVLGGMAAKVGSYAGSVAPNASAGATFQPPSPGAASNGAPQIRVTNWWTGESMRERATAPIARAASPSVVPQMSPKTWIDPRQARFAPSPSRSAQELRSAAATRRAAFKAARPGKAAPAGMNWGLGLAVMVVLGGIVLAIAGSFMRRDAQNNAAQAPAGAWDFGGQFDAGWDAEATAKADEAFKKGFAEADEAFDKAFADSNKAFADSDEAFKKGFGAGADAESGVDQARRQVAEAMAEMRRDLASHRAKRDSETGATPATPSAPIPPAQPGVPATPGVPETPSDEIRTDDADHFEGVIVLVASDVLAPRSPEADAAIAHVTTQLRKASITLLGNVEDDPNCTGERDLDEENALLASARNALGQAPTDGRDAAPRLATWIEKHQGEVDLVLWISPRASPGTEASQHPAPRFSLFGPSKDAVLNDDRTPEAYARIKSFLKRSEKAR